MEKILSARVDESVIYLIGSLARELNMTKKAIIEAAIELYSEQTKLDKKTDVFTSTFGAWQRSESPEETMADIRSVFNRSMKRYHQ